ncbi:hypothetical protein FSP39_000566 [Pinctada imbricata]|uniref:B box-type domain-containing protein n=1 Tax=Pinctada imbricata TaxID=66713 RepID=A0AA88XIT1_PINIB|nr:hypothetical protein FSP39_000566 [Pinctada imbricata]
MFCKQCEMDSCENEALWFCRNCPLSLCDRCKDQHLRTSIWRNHVTVPIHEGGALVLNKCRFHQNEVITHFCVDCDHTVCNMCIPEHSSNGKGHIFLSLPEAKSKKISELDKFRDIILEKIQPTFESTKNILEIKQSELKGKLEQLLEEIDAQKQIMIDNIVKISDEMKNCVKQYEKGYHQEMNDIKTAIEEGCEKISTVNKQCTDLHDAHLDAISDFLREKSDFETINPPSLPVIRPPRFLPGVFIPLPIKRQLGCLILPDHICEFQTSFPPNNILIDDISSTCSHVVLGNSYNKQLQDLEFHGTTLGNKEEVRTNVFTAGLAKAEDKTLIVSDRDNHRILRVMKNGKCEKLIDTGWRHPRGILINNRGEIVVCLSGISGKIGIYSYDGKCKKREIEKDVSGRSIVYSPQTIVQNYNGDYIIIDKNINQFLILAVHVDTSGYRKRWTFQGGEKVKNADFHPQGLVCDKLGNILISDSKNGEVIILSRDGKYLDCLLTSENGISKPLGLAIDSSGKLWVGQNEGDEGKLAIFKYFKD